MSVYSYGQTEWVTSGSNLFWENLKTHCGKSFEGELASATSNDTFTGKKLVMHVRSCDEENVIRIPFFVGEDRSRTWVLTKLDNGTLVLKHDHRHEDGSPDKITADQETMDLKVMRRPLYGGYFR